MGSVIMAAIMIVTMVTIVIVDLLRTIALRPRNEKLGNRSPKLHTSNVVHLVVNTSPNSRVASLLANGSNEIGMRREQVRQDLGPSGRECRVVRRVTWERRNREQGYDSRIKLMRPDVPVGELAILTCDKGIEEHRCDQRVCPRGARRILIEPVFKDPFVRMPVRPGL